MAHRAIALSGQKETEPATFGSLTAADVIRAPIVQRKIPVDFRSLLKPFKSAGRLSLRIERLPQGAKLSAGRRSTDNSWSLASDELEDLHYLVSSNVAPDHELTVRVMTFQDDLVSTLKVVQYAISASDAVPAKTGRDPQGHDPTIRSQLSEMHSLFAVRELELVELRAALQRAISEKDAELEQARNAWALELDRSVAEAVAQCRLHDELENDAKEADRKNKVAQDLLLAEQRITAELERLKVEFERRSEIERQNWQVEAARRLDAARQAWQADADESTAKERKRWNADTDQRIEATRQAWQAQSDERRRAELEKWKADAEKRIETERNKWQSQSDKHAAKERERWKTDAEQRMEAARQAWQAESDERRRVELESWKADAEKRVEEERCKLLAEGSEHAGSELERSRAEIESRIDAERQNWHQQAAKEAKEERDRWQVDTEQRIEANRRACQAEAEEQVAAERARLQAEAERQLEAERQNWQAQAGEQAKKERDRWEADTEQRMEAVRRACLAEADEHVAAERARLQAEIGQHIEAERQRLDDEFQAASKAAESLRESAVPSAAVDEHGAIQRIAEETDKSRQLSAALVAEANKCREMEKVLAAMTLRCESAERALTSADPRTPAADPEDGYVKSLRLEIVNLRKSLASQAAELGRARADLDQTRPLHIQRGPENRPLGNLRDVLAEDDETTAPAEGKGLVRDCIVVAAVVIPLVLLYPWFAGYLPQQVRSGIAFATGGLLSVDEEKPAVPHAPVHKVAPAPQIKRPTAIASRALNVHDLPALKGTVIFSLPKSTSVVVLETHGNWTRVEVPTEGAGNTQQGWVYSAYLQDKDN